MCIGLILTSEFAFCVFFMENLNQAVQQHQVALSPVALQPNKRCITEETCSKWLIFENTVGTDRLIKRNEMGENVHKRTGDAAGWLTSHVTCVCYTNGWNDAADDCSVLLFQRPITTICWGHRDSRLFLACGPALYVVRVEHRVASLQLLCQQGIASALREEKDVGKLNMPSLLCSYVTSAFIPTIKVHGRSLKPSCSLVTVGNIQECRHVFSRGCNNFTALSFLCSSLQFLTPTTSGTLSATPQLGTRGSTAPWRGLKIVLRRGDPATHFTWNIWAGWCPSLKGGASVNYGLSLSSWTQKRTAKQVSLLISGASRKRQWLPIFSSLRWSAPKDIDLSFLTAGQTAINDCPKCFWEKVK